MSAASAGNTGSSAGCRYKTGIYGWRIPALSRHQYSAGIHEYWRCLRPLSVSLFLFVCFGFYYVVLPCLGLGVKGAWEPPRQGHKGLGGGGVLIVLLALVIWPSTLSRRSTVPTPNRDTFNIWALITLLPQTT